MSELESFLVFYSPLVHLKAINDFNVLVFPVLQFKEWIDQDKILVLMMQERDLTLMAPTNQAIQTFLDKNPNLDTKKIKNLANYHTRKLVDCVH